MAPVLEKWENDGRMDYANLVYKRAYDMLRSADPFFDQQPKKSPPEIFADLCRRKLLVMRGDCYLFHHDLVRAFLVAKHFGPRWQQEMKKADLAIDSN